MKDLETMDYKYKLSIITVNKNNKKGLKKTLESVISQTNKEFEWIVIDGGSTDGSKEFLVQNNQYINYWISEPDNGIYHGMNKGINAASGEYLLFLNSGDVLSKNNIIFKILPLLKNFDVYIGDVKINNNFFQYNIDNLYYTLSTLYYNSLPHQGTFIRRSVFEKLGLYREDKTIVSDWAFFFKAFVLSNCTKKKLPYLISIMSDFGISSSSELCTSERQEIFSEIPIIKILIEFYLNNFYKIHKIEKSKILLTISKVISNSELSYHKFYSKLRFFFKKYLY